MLFAARQALFKCGRFLVSHAVISHFIRYTCPFLAHLRALTERMGAIPSPRALGRHSLPPCCPSSNVVCGINVSISTFVCARLRGLADMGFHGGIPSVSSISSAGEPSVGWIAGTSEKGLVAAVSYRHSQTRQIDRANSGSHIPVGHSLPEWTKRLDPAGIGSAHGRVFWWRHVRTLWC